MKRKFSPIKFGISAVVIVGIIFALVSVADGDESVPFILDFPLLAFYDDADNGIVGFIVDPNTGEKLDDNDFVIVNSEGTRIAVDGIGGYVGMACWLKQETDLYGSSGVKIATLKSPFLKSNPLVGFELLAITDRNTGLEIDTGSLRTQAEIKCSTGKLELTSPNSSSFYINSEPIDAETAFPENIGDELFIFPSIGQPVVIEPTELIVRIYAEQEDGTWLDTYNAKYTIFRTVVTDPQAIDFGDELRINIKDILKYLPEGDYDSTLRIVYAGNIILHWQEGGACNANCADIDLIIPIHKELSHNAEGKVTGVYSPLQADRTVKVSLDEDGGDDPIECPEGFIKNPDGDVPACVEVFNPDKGCELPKVKVGNLCVTKTTGGNGGNGGNGGGGTLTIPIITDLIETIQTCSASGSIGCFLQDEMIAFILVGFGGLVIIGAMFQRKKPDIYGVPNYGY